jgi:hypothetical protein
MCQQSSCNSSSKLQLALSGMLGLSWKIICMRKTESGFAVCIYFTKYNRRICSGAQHLYDERKTNEMHFQIKPYI